MDKKNTYPELIEILKRNRPVLTNREALAEDIMRKIREPSGESRLRENLLNYLFGWVDVYWVRGTMVAVAILFAGLFIVQQVIFAERLNTLEERLVKTVDTNKGREPAPGILHKVLLNIILKDQAMQDSITVSRTDLEELLNSYLELQQTYNSMVPGFDPERDIQKIIRQTPGKGQGEKKPL